MFVAIFKVIPIFHVDMMAAFYSVTIPGFNR